MAPISGGFGGTGGVIGAALFGERPRLYRGTRFNKVNFSLAKCDRGKRGNVCHDCDRPPCFGDLWREATARGKWRCFGVANRVGDYERGALAASSALADHAGRDRQAVRR
jgi:hypothetical protein